MSSVTDQRDRFLGFAFAASDLLLEVGGEGRVVTAFGAVKGLTGLDGESLKERVWTDLFIGPDQEVLSTLMHNAKEGIRSGPILATIQDNEKTKSESTLVSLIKMPGKDSLYITISYANSVTKRLAQAERAHVEDTGLLNPEGFADQAQEALRIAQESGQEADLTLFDLSNLDAMKGRVSDEQWGQMMDVMANLLKSRSLDGQTAAKISENQYGLLHDKSLSADSIMDQVSNVLKDHDPSGEGIEIETTSVDAKMEALSEREAARALMYTLQEFEKQGADLSIENLDDGFKGFLDENAKKIQQFKDMISKLDFQLHFQPIVSLPDLEISHYEVLTRFRDGGSPYEWIVFGEDVGLAADFDLAVCERAIRYILHDKSPVQSKFAINISGQSIQNEEFFAALCAKFEEHGGMSERIMFEITESAEIENLDLVNEYVGKLQGMGFKVCLDDFGAGSASFQYLHKLHVNTVKLDGAYTMNILENKRDETMVRNLAQLCQDLDVKIVAERVETAEEAKLLHEIGVAYGQGYWFSKPLPKPDYKVNSAKVTQVSG